MILDVLDGLGRVVLWSVAIPLICMICPRRSVFIFEDFSHAVRVLFLVNGDLFCRVDVRTRSLVGLDIHARPFYFAQSRQPAYGYVVSSTVLVEFGVLSFNGDDLVGCSPTGEVLRVFHERHAIHSRCL